MRFAKLLMVFGTLGLLAVATGYAAETTDCPQLSPDARFVDLSGDAVALAEVDAIALRELDRETVLVYRRTAADAESLVTDLAADGEHDPALLEPNTWLLAQVASCKMVAGSCKGNCIGKQKCKKVKKVGKNECTCMLD